MKRTIKLTDKQMEELYPQFHADDSLGEIIAAAAAEVQKRKCRAWRAVFRLAGTTEEESRVSLCWVNQTITVEPRGEGSVAKSDD